LNSGSDQTHPGCHTPAAIVSRKNLKPNSRISRQLLLFDRQPLASLP